MTSVSVQVIGAILCLVATVTAFPASLGDLNLKNIRESMEVVEGPKEFLVPLAPLKSLLESNSQLKISKGDDDKRSDLDYMVYGKVYLLRMMNVGDRRGGDSSQENSVNEKEAVETSRQPTIDNLPESSQPYEDAIEFPQQSRQTRRPYRYEGRSQKLTSGGTQFFHTPSRKLERSVSSTTESIGTSSTIIPTTKDRQLSSESQQADNVSSKLDEEDLELIQTQYPQTTTNGLSKTEINAGEATPGSKVVDENNGNFSFGDRFLINVPSKPNINICPEGQVRNHRNICKEIVSHNPSPQDGFFEGRITTGFSSRQKIPKPSNVGSNLHLTTLFRYITNREKYEIDRIRIISEAEKQNKPQLVMGQGNAEGSTSPAAENSN